MSHASPTHVQPSQPPFEWSVYPLYFFPYDDECLDTDKPSIFHLYYREHNTRQLPAVRDPIQAVQDEYPANYCEVMEASRTLGGVDFKTYHVRPNGQRFAAGIVSTASLKEAVAFAVWFANRNGQAIDAVTASTMILTATRQFARQRLHANRAAPQLEIVSNQDMQTMQGLFGG